MRSGADSFDMDERCRNIGDSEDMELLDKWRTCDIGRSSLDEGRDGILPSRADCNGGVGSAFGGKGCGIALGYGDG